MSSLIDEAALTNPVSALLPRFASDPNLYLHKIDTVRQSALLLVMREEDYLREIFLDDRMLERVTSGAWLPIEAVLEQIAVPVRAPHFIFHQGHTGSTLVSRLLDGLGGFGLREPAVLTEIAALYDRVGYPDALCARDGLDRFLRIMMHVWGRTFREGAVPIVKATSHAGRIGAEALQLSPQSRAIALSLRPERYLATLLAGQNSKVDLRGFAQERMRRCVRLFGEVSAPLHALSPGELAAMTWLVERASQVRYLANVVLAPRALDIDFDDFLSQPETQLLRIAAHFGVPAQAEAARAVLDGPIMRHYSKAPELAYTPLQRRLGLERARLEHGDEIRRGLAWLDQVGIRSAEAAGVIAFASALHRPQQLAAE